MGDERVGTAQYLGQIPFEAFGHPTRWLLSDSVLDLRSSGATTSKHLTKEDLQWRYNGNLLSGIKLIMTGSQRVQGH